ncbi:hypothetical protein CDEST_11124 [Colletotrichum destructivum]|uniref:Uncharacterized protein n=1 Tax=Colletotrichum destructivum TaxID=34406 RepID=A0AAX4IS75_9PEZI|nr:hypothetical protein CDEST_11124 [Colletotrichum destructivum]
MYMVLFWPAPPPRNIAPGSPPHHSTYPRSRAVPIDYKLLRPRALYEESRA